MSPRTLVKPRRLRPFVILVPPLRLTPRDRDWLETFLSLRRVPPRFKVRARIVLALGAGEPDRAVAREQGVSRQTVALWRTRVLAHGVQTVASDAPGRGRKPVIPAAKRQAVRRAWLESHRRGCRLSVRALASTFGLSSSTAHRIVEPLFAVVRE
jgi:hypothetical protein